MDKQEATQEIANLLKEAEQKLEQARKVADEYSVSFSFSMGSADNVSRSIAGEYFGKGMELGEGDVYEVNGEYMDSDHLDLVRQEEKESKYGNYTESTYKLNRGAWSAWQSSSEQC